MCIQVKMNKMFRALKVKMRNMEICILVKMNQMVRPLSSTQEHENIYSREDESGVEVPKDQIRNMKTSILVKMNEDVLGPKGQMVREN